MDTMPQSVTVPAITATNDFVVKFANVNGSGSASANEMFARAIIRMGVPVAPRNVFPSNIQGMPTWYEVRVTEQGWLGRRGGCDLMVALNAQTWDADVAEIGARLGPRLSRVGTSSHEQHPTSNAPH